MYTSTLLRNVNGLFEQGEKMRHFFSKLRRRFGFDQFAITSPSDETKNNNYLLFQSVSRQSNMVSIRGYIWWWRYLIQRRIISYLMPVIIEFIISGWQSFRYASHAVVMLFPESYQEYAHLFPLKNWQLKETCLVKLNWRWDPGFRNCCHIFNTSSLSIFFFFIMFISIYHPPLLVRQSCGRSQVCLYMSGHP